VLDSYFNLAINLISLTGLNTIFDILVVAYFFGPRCIWVACSGQILSSAVVTNNDLS